MSITSKDMLKVFTTEVVENIRTPESVEEYARCVSEPAFYELRITTTIGGAYWALRSLSIQLSYEEGNSLVRAMDTFFDKHCKNILEVNDMVEGE